jgi:hypothetical protein
MIAPPTGWVQPGGLNSGGCDLTGNFFCDNLNVSTNPDVGDVRITAAGQQFKVFVFDVTISSGTFAAYNASTPSLKVDWVGFTDAAGLRQNIILT